MFGFDHSLEAYVPKAKRVHGYFAMPLLAGGRLLGRVDPVRQGQTLVARQLSLSSAAATRPWRGRCGRRRNGSAAPRSLWSGSSRPTLQRLRAAARQLA